MNDIRDFCEMMKEKIREAFSDDMKDNIVLNDAEVTKINDQKLLGLTFKRKGNEAAPAIYLNKYFDQYMRGRSTDDIRNEIMDLYTNSLAERTPEVPPELDYETVKDNLTIKVVDIKRNREYLSEHPYMMLGSGLAAVCDIRMYEELDGMWQTTVTNDFMEKQGYDKAELFRQAMQNAEKVDPPELTAMGANLFAPEEKENLLDTKDEISEDAKEPMYVLSNESGMFGAAVLFYPGMQERIADKLGEGYYALPSSLHEYIVVPESAGIDEKQLTDMVKQANDMVVAPGDVLSDSVLHYDKESRNMDSVANLMSMESKQQEIVC